MPNTHNPKPEEHIFEQQPVPLAVAPTERLQLTRLDKAVAATGILLAAAAFQSGVGKQVLHEGSQLAGAAYEHVLDRGTMDEKKLVQENLERYQAEQIGHIQTKSGIRTNIYRSRLDAKKEPLVINEAAFELLADTVIEEAQNIEGSPVNSQMAEVKKKAEKGELDDLELNIVLASDEKLCMPKFNPEIETVKQRAFIPKTRTSCYAVGMHIIPQKKEGVKHHFIVAVDSGRQGPKKYFSDAAKKQGQILTPDQTLTMTVAHELGHALYHYVDQEALTSGQFEHTKFVNKIESRTYDLLCKLRNGETTKTLQNTADIAPAHVDNGPKFSVVE